MVGDAGEAAAPAAVELEHRPSPGCGPARPDGAVDEVQTLHLNHNQITDFTPLNSITGLTTHGRNHQDTSN